VRDATENLEYVMDYAWPLAQDLDGRTVFTADHGEMFGEWRLASPIRVYSHPNELRYAELVTVPWAVHDDERLTVRDDGTSSRADLSDEEIDQRLRDLGYRTRYCRRSRRRIVGRFRTAPERTSRRVLFVTLRGSWYGTARGRDGPWLAETKRHKSPDAPGWARRCPPHDQS